MALGLLVLVCLYRAIQGPTIMDRIVSVSVIGTKTTVILLLIGFIYDRADMFIDISMGYAILNFIGTLAISKFFFSRKSIIPGSKHLKQGEASK
jgi:multicomponent Na+:H+ antiporter subunit F